MIAKLRRIPDTVDDFTGFSIPWDVIAGTFGRPRALCGHRHGARAQRDAARRNQPHAPSGDRCIWPPTTSRARWIDAWSPERTAPPPDGPGVDTTNLVHAADIWYSVKQHWCRSAQQRAARPGAPLMRGKLNLFQATMLRWRELHPYSAVHAVHVAAPLDAARLRSGDRAANSRRADSPISRWMPRTTATTMPAAHAHGRAAGAGRRRRSAARPARRNRAPAEPAVSGRRRARSVPVLRGRRTTTSFDLALAYDHFIAGGDSIVLLLQAIVARYEGAATAPAPPQPVPGAVSAHVPARFCGVTPARCCAAC